MFDALKNLGNLAGMMKRAQQMQEQLAAMEVTGDSPSGSVTATVNGKQELVKLQIDKLRIDVNNTQMLQDMIVAAVQAAQAKAQELMKDEMQKAMGDVKLPPGLLP